MIFTHMVDIIGDFILTRGQGHGVKGQGQQIYENIGSPLYKEQRIGS